MKLQLNPEIATFIKLSGLEDSPELRELLHRTIRLCAIQAELQMLSTGFDNYDELDQYERGQDDTASLISSRINNYKRGLV